MSIPIPSIIQSGYRKEVTIMGEASDPGFPAADSFFQATGTRTTQWALDINLTNFSSTTTKVSGTFTVELPSWTNITNIKNKLAGRTVIIDYVSNSEKLVHRWITTILEILEVKEGDNSTAFFVWTIKCDFELPMIEVVGSAPHSYVSGWWTDDF